MCLKLKCSLSHYFPKLLICCLLSTYQNLSQVLFHGSLSYLLIRDARQRFVVSMYFHEKQLRYDIEHTQSLTQFIGSSKPGEVCSWKILKSETNRDIKKSNQYHLNIQKSYIDFAKEKGCGTKIKPATPIFILNSKQPPFAQFCSQKNVQKTKRFRQFENNLSLFLKFWLQHERYC